MYFVASFRPLCRNATGLARYLHCLKKPIMQVHCNCTHGAPKRLATQPNFLDLKADVDKDIVLYKYEQPRRMRMLHLFCVFQCLLCYGSANFVYSFFSGKENLTAEDMIGVGSSMLDFSENTVRYAINAAMLLLAGSMYGAVCMYMMHCVRLLILRKGGRNISIVTYSPLTTNRIITVPLSHVSAETPRLQAKREIILKVLNKWLAFNVHMRGEFRNPALFDVTVGMKRYVA